MNGENAYSILGRVVNPASGDLTRPAAESILRMSFSPADHDRLQILADKCTDGTLTAEERSEYEGYVLIGELIALMQAKARLSLQEHPSAA